MKPDHQQSNLHMSLEAEILERNIEWKSRRDTPPSGDPKPEAGQIAVQQPTLNIKLQAPKNDQGLDMKPGRSETRPGMKKLSTDKSRRQSDSM